jgi:hypothetical protein
MKKLLLFTILLAVLISCGGRKQVEKALYSGNYDKAISNALNKLKTNKDKKRKQAYVVMLEDAYYKAVARDLETIDRLKKENNPELYKQIFEIYTNLDARQEAIKPVMPLQIDRKTVNFKFNDYSDDIVESREKVSDYLYEIGLDLLDSDDKFKIREAYKTYKYIESINPNYDKTRELMDEAYQRGLDFVIVSIENQTHQIIPSRLEDDLLNFDTYGLNQFWTVYHANNDTNISYDFAMQLQLKQINISPERINERQILREREIIDGWEYELDGDGNVVKDSLGNDIKIDKIVNVRCRFFEYEQFKSSQVIADVTYIDLKSNQLLQTFPIESEFVFENLYARIRGDKRALTTEDRNILNNSRVPFPSNEQMVYDTGEDLKLKLKDIINSYRIQG